MKYMYVYCSGPAYRMMSYVRVGMKTVNGNSSDVIVAAMYMYIVRYECREDTRTPL